MEEASHMKKDVFFKIILPIWALNNCAILGISTAEGEFNYYSELMSLTKEDGTNMFRVLQIVLACRDCVKAGKGKSCKHMDALQPAWKSQRKLRELRAIYAADPELYARENQGLMETRTLFHFREYLPKLKKQPLYIFSRQFAVSYVAIDPHGGGKHSNYALASGVIDGAHLVVSHIVHALRSIACTQCSGVRYLRLDSLACSLFSVERPLTKASNSWPR